MRHIPIREVQDFEGFPSWVYLCILTEEVRCPFLNSIEIGETMQRKATVARWFEVVVYYLKDSEDPSLGRRYHKNTIGFSSTQTLGRLKAKGNELSKGLPEVSWLQVDNLRGNSPAAFFVIHPIRVVLDPSAKRLPG